MERKTLGKTGSVSQEKVASSVNHAFKINKEPGSASEFITSELPTHLVTQA